MKNFILCECEKIKHKVYKRKIIVDITEKFVYFRFAFDVRHLFSSEYIHTPGGTKITLVHLQMSNIK